MKFIIDTHVLLWFDLDDTRLSTNARSLMEALDSEVTLSVASAWEIAIKVSSGGLTLPEPVPAYFEGRIERGLRIAPIEWRHAAKVAELPFHHRDPFDRLIAAHALIENLPLVTRDPIFKKYGVKLIW